jgi:TolB-like protein/tetratricopeptide (TPR) repeat protein/predicted Ser/Thr protein kinase
VAIPERIGRYRIDRELGRGGMGVVYAAYDEQLERPVAIKTIVEPTPDEQARKRFQREARTAARIHHPNVCHIYEIGEDGDELFIAMEFLEGESLAGRLVRGPLPIPEAVEISLEILSALDGLHGAGVVHRDLKPSNVFLTPHGVKILDFGLARAAPSDVIQSREATTSGLTQAGAIVGTPAYMAPEQIQGDLIDARTDLFAMGAVIFEMIMGCRAFAGRTPMEVYHRTLYEQPPALGGSPAAIAADRVIRRALAKRPEDRYAKASEMADALRGLREIEVSGVTRAHAITRLIVLPFRVLRPDPDTDFLAVSIPDAVTGALTGLESLVVRSSAAAARFAAGELDFRRLAEEADVDVALTGSLLRAGPQVRVTAQLVEVPGGTLLWSHAPQVALRDVFQLQDQIVDRIVESLSLSLTAREHRSLKTDVPASPTAYEFFLRGNQLILTQGVTSAQHLYVAREFYERCVQEDPRYAPGWARLGRCHWLIGKGGDDRDENVRRAEASFEQALALNPELPLALNLYALLEIDQGRAQDAMVRLLGRARAGGGQPELYAALVQACRFCGLLEASVAAHERAQQLDRNILTSVDHTWWHLRDYDHALEYVTRRHYGEVSITNRAMRGMILSELGRKDEAIRQWREIEEAKLTEFFRDTVCMYRALLEGRREESLEAVERLLLRALDAETLWQVARVLAYFGERTRALAVFDLSLERGFILYRILTREDPWLDALRSGPEFGNLLRGAELRYHAASAAFSEAGGEQLLGVGPRTELKEGKEADLGYCSRRAPFPPGA